MKIVIRAGGFGSRLWPMSRKAFPKQFQAVHKDKSMLRETYERVEPFVGAGNIYISVNQEFKKEAAGEVPELKEDNFIIETHTRNTGPAICLENCFLEKRLRKDDIVATLPSDDFISNPGAFREMLESAEEFLKAHHDFILTPAIKPAYPDTGYSYLKKGARLEDSIFEVEEVVEKPDRETCAGLIRGGEHYCHTGMYVWNLGFIIAAFQKYQPEMYVICRESVECEKAGSHAKAAEAYGRLEKISIESAITEKVSKIAMIISDDMGWSDLGKWHIIKNMFSGRGENLEKGLVIMKNSQNNLAYNLVKNKVMVLNDVENLAVIDTEEALLVTSLNNSAEIKKILDEFKTEEELKKFL